MDFKEAWRVHTKLKEQFDQGRLSADEFEKRINEMTVTDDRGQLWQIGVSSGKWYRYDGQNWVEDAPPEFISTVPSPKATATPVTPIEPRSGAFNWLWLGGGLVVLVIAGCIVALTLLFIFNQNKPLPVVTTVPQPSLITPQTVIKTPVSGQTALPGFDPNSVPFFDDFSNPASGWNQERSDDQIIDYENNGYRILVNKANWSFWATPGKNFTGDVVVEVDAVRAGGPNENGFGVICRFQNENNYYRFMISSDGLNIISKKQDGKWLNLSADQWESSDAIHQGAASNHLRVECIGDTLNLFVNDQPVANASDSSFTSGDVGLTASAYDSPGVDILFDNFSASSR